MKDVMKVNFRSRSGVIATSIALILSFFTTVGANANSVNTLGFTCTKSGNLIYVKSKAVGSYTGISFKVYDGFGNLLWGPTDGNIRLLKSGWSQEVLNGANAAKVDIELTNKKSDSYIETVICF